MTFRTRVFIIIGCCFLFLLKVDAQQQGKPSPLAKETGWTILIIEATQPDKYLAGTMRQPLKIINGWSLKSKSKCPSPHPLSQLDRLKSLMMRKAFIR